MFNQKVNLKKGLVAYYSFTKNANDESGNGNHGEVHDAVLTMDRFGNFGAYSFNGVSSYIKVSNGNRFNFEQDMSVSVWIKPNKVQLSCAIIIYNVQDVQDMPRQSWQLHECCGSSGCYMLQYALKGRDAWAYSVCDCSTMVAIADEQWNHITAVKTGKYIDYFLNGIKRATVAKSEAYIENCNSGLSFIGALWQAGKDSRHFKGLIDDIAIYDRALSEAEVQALYSASSKGPLEDNAIIPMSLLQLTQEVIALNKKMQFLEAEKARSQVYIAKLGQKDRIVIQKDTGLDQKTIKGTELDKCRNIILGFTPLSPEEKPEDRIDLSQFGITNKHTQVSFETISGTGDTAISGIKIAGQDGFVACVQNFDATHFECSWGAAIDLILTDKQY